MGFGSAFSDHPSGRGALAVFPATGYLRATGQKPLRPQNLGANSFESTIDIVGVANDASPRSRSSAGGRYSDGNVGGVRKAGVYHPRNKPSRGAPERWRGGSEYSPALQASVLQRRFTNVQKNAADRNAIFVYWIRKLQLKEKSNS